MRLFWKIFLAFWITTIVMVVTSVWTTTFIARNKAPSVSAQTIASAVDEVASTIETSGLEGVRNPLLKGFVKNGVRIDVSDDRGRTVRGSRLQPKGFLERIAVFATGSQQRQREVQAANGALYTVSARPARNDARRLILQYQWIRIVLMLFVSGLICYVLARYIARPLTELSGTSKLIADGELSARVSDKVCQRRDEFGALGRDYNSMTGRLVDQLNRQTQLLRDVSHELRSPLTRLQVAIGLVDREANASNMKPIDRIETEAGRLEDMIGRILSVSRMENSEQELDLQPLEIVELVSDVARDARYEARASNKDVIMHLAAPIESIGDDALIRSAVENIVRNAIRYTDAQRPVEIRVAREQNGSDRAVISVFDGGPGVPEEDLEKLFDPFFRVSSARDRHTGGVGLGLSIAERAVRVHGGEIAARNRVDGGLCVSIRLPVQTRGTLANTDRRITPSLGATSDSDEPRVSVL